MHPHTLFDALLHVHYGQFYVEPEDGEYIDMAAAFKGQRNGLCGAAQANRLFLTTGLHTGEVYVRVALHAAEPRIDPAWEEVVECSLAHASDELHLCQWGYEMCFLLPIPRGTYRVRYSAKTMLGDWEVSEEHCPLQTYQLEFWPSPYADDRVLKVTRPCARHRHAAVEKK